MGWAEEIQVASGQAVRAGIEERGGCNRLGWAV